MAKSLIIYETEMNVLLSLTDEQRGRIVGAIICGLTGAEPPELTGADKAIFTLVNAQAQRAAALSEKRRQSGQLSRKNRSDESDHENNAAYDSSESAEANAKQNETKSKQNEANAEQNEANAEHHNHNLNHNQNDNHNPDQNENDNPNGNNNPSPLAPRGGKRGGLDSESIKLFDKFWEAYPRKTAKQQALKVWQSLKPDNGLLEVILAALDKQKRSEQWTRDNGRFIPYPATWISGRRWEDVMEVKTHNSFDDILNRTDKEWLGGFTEA